MSFCSKAKQWLNVGGVSVKLQVPERVERYGGAVAGFVTVTTKSEQHVKDLQFELVEEFEKGYGDNKEKKTYIIGQVTLPETFTINVDDQRRFEFTLPYQLQNSMNDNLRAHGGVYGVIGTVGEMMDGERSRYFVSVMADVTNAGFDPSDMKEIFLVGDRMPDTGAQIEFDKEIY